MLMFKKIYGQPGIRLGHMGWGTSNKLYGAPTKLQIPSCYICVTNLGCGYKDHYNFIKLYYIDYYFSWIIVFDLHTLPRVVPHNQKKSRFESILILLVCRSPVFSHSLAAFFCY